jgi:hypothetical protein
VNTGNLDEVEALGEAEAYRHVQKKNVVKKHDAD